MNREVGLLKKMRYIIEKSDYARKWIQLNEIVEVRDTVNKYNELKKWVKFLQHTDV